ncbi:hypothetical protein CWI38_0366p0010 [Hamiltosporidium tvaerminnensis]|uniref:Uncharacterized protein n=1 Tax=Hamiltosporidium tvaerminnensis TaxID=1176355 RepID=A0A4Q9M0R1_9MICR|nr:hypothetical protein CWI38_0366p0010 [Hamiltosporidium tvaerminnensis]
MKHLQNLTITRLNKIEKLPTKTKTNRENLKNELKELFGKNIQKNMNSYEESGRSKNNEGIEETWERLKNIILIEAWFDEEYKIALHAKPGTKYIVTETNAPEKIYLYKKDISRVFECIFNIRGLPDQHIIHKNTLPSFSYSDSSVCRPDNIMEDLNTADIPEKNRLILLHLILDSVTAAKRNAEGRRIATCLTEPCLLTDNKLYKHQRDVVCTIPKLSEKKKENRLHIPSKKLRRGFYSVMFKSEHILLQLVDSTILKVENENNNHFAETKTYLKITYDKKSVRPLYKTVFCYTQDIHLFCGNEGVRPTATLRTKQLTI